MLKRFLEWFGLKQNIHSKEHTPPLFKEGEIWWCHIGENIGMEINGKGEIFTRPIYIFRKYDRYSFLGLPLSTKLKSGSWYMPIYFKEMSQIIVLSQGRTCDYRRLKEKIGQLSKTDIETMRVRYLNLHIK